MNLHALASGVVGTVNPHVSATLQVSLGYTTAQDGSRTPIYAAPQSVMAQTQALTFQDLQQLDSLNIQGVRRAIYLYGEADGVVRVTQKGGDLITLTDGVNAGLWLVVQVLETWPDWVKCACTLQNGA